MTRPWTTRDRVASAGGALELRRRGEREFLITVAGRVLMSSAAHGSESALAEWLCEDLADHRRPRVLIGGLGMGYT
ncbi:MAG: spermidine synthase, partial [Vicinamibacterales bacterium]